MAQSTKLILITVGLGRGAVSFVLDLAGLGLVGFLAITGITPTWWLRVRGRTDALGERLRVFAEKSPESWEIFKKISPGLNRILNKGVLWFIHEATISQKVEDVV